MKQILILAAAAMVVAAGAQPSNDGVAITSKYPGALIAAQSNYTGFGDNFSELNTLWGFRTLSTLYLGVAGNLEGNFNNLHIYIDSIPGGGNPFFLNQGCLNCSVVGMSGVVWDSGFTPDYVLSISHGGGVYYVDLIDITTDTSCYQGEGYTDSFSGLLFGGSDCATSGLLVAFNNTNSMGITSDSNNLGDPFTCSTGFDIQIPISAIAATGPIKAAALITGGANLGDLCGSNSLPLGTYVSNQMLPAMNSGNPGSHYNNLAWSHCPDALGGANGIEFTQATGDQCADVVWLGDVNGDWCVDDADLAIVLENFGTDDEQADVNGDGIVDDTDLAIVLSSFGVGC
ncbi:MAG: hypothetical protein HUU60_00635 [Armatimonadetes bacterium]|nr:hypothetical protein [Armatimonadota bacterium]